MTSAIRPPPMLKSVSKKRKARNAGDEVPATKFRRLGDDDKPSRRVSCLTQAVSKKRKANNAGDEVPATKLRRLGDEDKSTRRMPCLTQTSDADTKNIAIKKGFRSKRPQMLDTTLDTFYTKDEKTHEHYNIQVHVFTGLTTRDTITMLKSVSKKRNGNQAEDEGPATKFHRLGGDDKPTRRIPRQLQTCDAEKESVATEISFRGKGRQNLVTALAPFDKEQEKTHEQSNVQVHIFTGFTVRSSLLNCKRTIRESKMVLDGIVSRPTNKNLKTIPSNDVEKSPIMY